MFGQPRIIWTFMFFLISTNVIYMIFPAFSNRFASEVVSDFDLSVIMNIRPNWNDTLLADHRFSSERSNHSLVQHGESADQSNLKGRNTAASQPNDQQNSKTERVGRKLDTVIAGFPKCGTSALLAWLGLDPGMKLSRRERCELCDGKADSLVGLLHQELGDDERFKRGIKCPRMLEDSSAMTTMTSMFPGSSVIVGLRHPVLWFESFYNLKCCLHTPLGFNLTQSKVRLRKRFDLYDTTKLIGDCSKIGPPKRTGNSCTDRSRFHEFLAPLGKTNLTSPVEKNFFRTEPNTDGLQAADLKIFLYEVSQMDDDNEHRERRFRQDLSSFLQLETTLAPLPKGVKPNSKEMEVLLNRTAAVTQIDICDPEHEKVRLELMKNALDASRWIRTYFIRGSGVSVSSPSHFAELLKGWERDPCLDRGS